MLSQSNVLLKQVTSSPNISVHTFNILPDDEMKLKISLKVSPIPTQTGYIYIEFEKAIADISYTSDNNTLNGHIHPSFSGNYLDSDINTFIGTNNYITLTGDNDTLEFMGNSYSSLSVPTGHTQSSGSYTQFGNGSFNKGKWNMEQWV